MRRDCVILQLRAELVSNLLIDGIDHLLTGKHRTKSLPRIERMQTDQISGKAMFLLRALACPCRHDITVASEKILCAHTLSPMHDQVFKANNERVGCGGGISRRVFLRATLAGGASLLAGRAGTLFAIATSSDQLTF